MRAINSCKEKVIEFLVPLHLLISCIEGNTRYVSLLKNDSTSPIGAKYLIYIDIYMCHY